MNKQDFLIIIPWRTGSKRCPGKNERDFCGKPLWEWSKECAKATGINYVVSSDKMDRPWFLAQDHTRIEEVVGHVLINSTRSPNWVVLLQPTSPLRTPDDVIRACERAHYYDADSVVSMCYEETHEPHFWYSAPNARGRTKNAAEKATKPMLWRNGSIYVTKVDYLMGFDKMFSSNPIPYIMPPEQSMDINTEFEFYLAECAAKKLMEEGKWPKSS